MGQNLRTLMENSVQFRRRVSMAELLRAAKLDNPIPYTQPRIGDMLTFNYSAKTKDKLPYWDSFPLIFVVDILPKGFYGLNLHYLPIDLRKLLFKKLELLTYNFPVITPNSRLNLTYQTLVGTQKYPEFHPCFKHYLTTQVRSQLLKIDATEWGIAIQLPFVSFNKATASQVHTDSRKIIFNKRYTRRR